MNNRRNAEVAEVTVAPLLFLLLLLHSAFLVRCSIFAVLAGDALTLPSPEGRGMKKLPGSLPPISSAGGAY
jgi:hypothetical protein